MAGNFVKLVLVASALSLCFFSGESASVVQLTSIVSQAVEETLPSRVQAHIYGHGVQARRFKREITTKTLEDLDGCIKKCSDNETSMVMEAMFDNMKRLLLLIKDQLKNATEDDFRSDKDQAALKERVMRMTINNMGPFLADLCRTSTVADQCIASCPSSLLKNLTVLDHSANAAASCEPSKNWKSFAEYWEAANCTNSTKLENSCDNKCGSDDVQIRKVTHFELEESDDGEYQLTYENDAKKNNAAVGPVCKTINCNIDCYKPRMAEKCGAKAYEMYVRMTEFEPRIGLKGLKELDAIADNPACKNFQ